jgi:hypothetical protein
MMERVRDFVERQPLWRFYGFVIVLAIVVGTARGHSVETSIDNVLFVVIVLAIGDSIRWLSRRRRSRQLQ